MNLECPFCHSRQDSLWELFVESGGPTDYQEVEGNCDSCGRPIKVVAHVTVEYEVKLG